MQGHKPNKVYNNLVQGTGLLSFGKLPFLFEENSLSAYSIQCNIKNYTLPTLTAEMLYDRFLAHAAVVPTSSVNDYSALTLDVTLICDEDLENYTVMYRWLDVYKKTMYRTGNNTADEKHWDAKQAFCPVVDILIYNNNNVVKNIIRFKKVFITTLGGIFQDFLSDEPITFQASFKFDEFYIINDEQNINDALGEYV
jgi:hypothetical protein